MPQARTSPTLDRFLAWSLDRTPSLVARYAIATVVIVAVGVLRMMLITALLPWLLFIPAVLAIGLTMGSGPGTYAAGLATIIAAISIGDPREAMWLTPPQWIGSALFLVVSSGIAILASNLRGAFARARRLTIEKDQANAALAERETFLSSVLGSSTDGIAVLDLEGRLQFVSEVGRRMMGVSDGGALAGTPWRDMWDGVRHQEAEIAIAGARAGLAGEFVARTGGTGGKPLWWHVAVSPILGADGAPERILSVARDITASRGSEEERDQLARIVENSADFIGMAKLDGRIFFLNEAACRLVGLDQDDVGTVSLFDFFPPDEAAIVRTEVLPAVAAHGSWAGERMFRHFRTGELIPILYTVFPVMDRDGTLIGYGTVTRDFRERKRAEEQQLLLNTELEHRLKNVLTVVQSIAGQTLRQAEDLPSANAALSARLAALGEATNVLTASSWSAADLREVVLKALAPHGVIGKRLRVAGPALMLNAQVALAFALALHELATNAAKYGALSDAVGHIDIAWSVREGADGDDRRFLFTWREIGGPAVRPPSRRGFGSMMIERSLRSYFRGQALLDYRPDGLTFTLDAPLGDAGMVRE